jgi:acyl-CoA reductase-like NAD-dependent aldehyde dehydrogenase
MPMHAVYHNGRDLSPYYARFSKESGLGREGGKASLYEYTEKQSINWLA